MKEDFRELLSIYIPTSDRADYLKFCLNNIVNKAQRFNLKVFISDNFSQDSTEIVVNGFQKQYDNIFYYKQKQKISLDENQLFFLKVVDTRFCLMIADDDALELNGLETILYAIQNKPDIDLILLNAYHYSSDMQLRKYPNINYNEDVVMDDPRKLLKNNFFDMHFSTLVLNMVHAAKVNPIKYYGTFHAYCGVAFEYLHAKYAKAGLCSILLLSEPTIMLRDGEKTYSKETISVYYKRFPSFFLRLPEFYRKEAKIKLRQLAKNNVTTTFLIRQKMQGTLALGNIKETFEYLSTFQKLKVLMICLVPFAVFRVLITLYRGLLKIKHSINNDVAF